MAKSKLPPAKTRKLSKRAKTHQPAGSVKTNKTRKPGDIELSERELKRITGGRAIHAGSDTIF